MAPGGTSVAAPKANLFAQFMHLGMKAQACAIKYREVIQHTVQLAQLVCCDHNSAVLGRAVEQCAAQLPLCFHIQSTGRLIQQQQACWRRCSMTKHNHAFLRWP